MLSKERMVRIVQLLEERQFVTVKELQEVLMFQDQVSCVI